MPGRIVYVPEPPTECTDEGCTDMPMALPYTPGTIWECDTCGRRWEVIEGDAAPTWLLLQSDQS